MKTSILKYYLILPVIFIAISSCATPPPTTVTDIDGNVYQTVTIGSQTWMAENLKVTKYQNGDPIPNVSIDTSWVNLTTGAYCNYNNDSSFAVTCGRLYNWYAVNDSRKIAPVGWHIPTDAEWATLEYYLGGYSIAGGKMKASGSDAPAWDGTNTSGFKALCFGSRNFSDGSFNPLGSSVFYWSATVDGSTYVWYRCLLTGSPQIYRASDRKTYGWAIRCIKD